MYHVSVDMAACPCSVVRLQDTMSGKANELNGLTLLERSASNIHWLYFRPVCLTL